eukprot:3067951-Pyramimonas_sp.AAC.1
MLGVSEASWAVLATSWRLHGLSWVILEAFGAILGRSWGSLGPSAAVGRPKRSRCQNHPTEHQ